MKSNQKNKTNIKEVFTSILSIIAFGGIGAVIGFTLSKNAMSCPLKGSSPIDGLLGGIIALYLAFYIQVIIHELGHMVFGLLTGYRFASFRVGNLMLVKINGKLKFKKYSLAGTGGQCIMSPPDQVDGKIPYVLYNLGGAIFNFISSLIAFLLIKKLNTGFSLYVFLGTTLVSGLYLGVVNAIPIKKLGNDGYNIKQISQSQKANQAFWGQLKVNELQTNGIRIKDMPEELLQMPTDEDLENMIIASMAVFHTDSIMDRNDFVEAEKEISSLLEKETNLHPLNRSLLKVDLIYTYLVNRTNLDKITDIIDKEFENFLKLMKKYPSVIRTEYAYATLRDKDEKKADKYLKEFDKVSKNFPYASVIESEREKIEYAKKVYEKTVTN